MYETVYHGFLLTCMIVTAALIILCLIRAVLGPRLTDRVTAVNMIGTMTIVEIAMFALYLRESYLFDVCLIYAMSGDSDENLRRRLSGAQDQRNIGPAGGRGRGTGG